MAEYIEREKVVELIKNFGKGAIEDGQKNLDPVDDIILLSKAVDLIPSADVVKVVRCKDCKYYIAEYCTRDIKGRINMFYMKPDDFCSYGEPKESEVDTE